MSNTDFGYGQINPITDGASDLQVILAAARSLIERIDVMKLVKVTAIHPGKGTPPVGGIVDVQLLVSQIDGAGNPVQHGIVFGIPVFRLQAGPWAIIADPAVGDYGFLVCADRDSSLVLKQPGIANPGSRRRYSVSDGVYLGGVGSMNPAPTAYLQLNSDGSLNLTDKFGNVVKTSNSGIAITGNVEVTGNITATGTITALAGSPATKVGLSTHTHPSNGAPPTPGT